MLVLLAFIVIIVWFLLKSKWMKISVLLLAVLLSLYHILLTFTPVYLPDQTDKEVFPVALAEGYLKYCRLPLNGLLEEYYINSAQKVVYDEMVYVKISFDVKPRIKNMDCGGWLVGNGREGENGWVVNKSLFLKYVKLGSVYLITDECSLP